MVDTGSVLRELGTLTDVSQGRRALAVLTSAMATDKWLGFTSSLDTGDGRVSSRLQVHILYHHPTAATATSTS